jgi:hypothetical protein
VNKESQSVRMPTSVENAFELMNEPGEWYYDKASRTFYYVPLPGEDLNNLEVVAPVLETLVSARGTAGNPVSNVLFTGITFAYATWLRPSGADGFVEIQANFVLVGNPPAGEILPANVAFRHVRNIRLERNRFVHLGGTGLALDGGSQGNVIVGNVFTDISGTAVRIGDVTTPNASDAMQDRRNWVVNNYVHDTAVEYRGGVGIMAGYVAETLLSHNEIFNVPYSAVSLGWGWGTDSYAHSNEVSYNHIHDYTLVLSDGGGIYTLSPQGSADRNWSSVHRNSIHNQRHNYGGLYFDEGSAYLEAHGNALASTPFWLFIWTGSIHDIFAHDNFSDTDSLRNDGTRITVQNNITGGALPAAAQDVIDGAGLEPAYRDIRGP